MNEANNHEQEIIIDREIFFDFYFKEEEQFGKLLKHIGRYEMSKKALTKFKLGNPTLGMVENGIPYYVSIIQKSMPAAMKELKFLSTLSRMLYGHSMVNGVINSEHGKECYQAMADIADIMLDDAGIDIE